MSKMTKKDLLNQNGLHHIDLYNVFSFSRTLLYIPDMILKSMSFKEFTKGSLNFVFTA